MVRIFTQTDSAAQDGSIAACSGLSQTATDQNRQMAEGGTAGTTEVTVTVSGPAGVGRGYHIQSEPQAMTNSWPSGNWTVRFNVTTSNSAVEWDECYICRVATNGSNVGSIASVTGLNITNTLGVKTHTFSGVASNTRSAGTNDEIYIVFGFDNLNPHGNASFGITPDQDVDTPIPEESTPQVYNDLQTRTLAGSTTRATVRDAFRIHHSACVSTVGTNEVTLSLDAGTEPYRMILAAVGYSSGSVRTATNVSFAVSNDMLNQRHAVRTPGTPVNDDVGLEVFYYVNPEPGTNVLRLGLDGTPSAGVVCGVSFVGAQQAAPRLPLIEAGEAGSVTPPISTNLSSTNQNIGISFFGLAGGNADLANINDTNFVSAESIFTNSVFRLEVSQADRAQANTDAEYTISGSFGDYQWVLFNITPAGVPLELDLTGRVLNHALYFTAPAAPAAPVNLDLSGRTTSTTTTRATASLAVSPVYNNLTARLLNHGLYFTGPSAPTTLDLTGRMTAGATTRATASLAVSPVYNNLQARLLNHGLYFTAPSAPVVTNVDLVARLLGSASSRASLEFAQAFVDLTARLLNHGLYFSAPSVPVGNFVNLTVRDISLSWPGGTEAAVATTVDLTARVTAVATSRARVELFINLTSRVTSSTSTRASLSQELGNAINLDGGVLGTQTARARMQVLVQPRARLLSVSYARGALGQRIFPLGRTLSVTTARAQLSIVAVTPRSADVYGIFRGDLITETLKGDTSLARPRGQTVVSELVGESV